MGMLYMPGSQRSRVFVSTCGREPCHVLALQQPLQSLLLGLGPVLWVLVVQNTSPLCEQNFKNGNYLVDFFVPSGMGAKLKSLTFAIDVNQTLSPLVAVEEHVHVMSAKGPQRTNCKAGFCSGLTPASCAEPSAPVFISHCWTVFLFASLCLLSPEKMEAACSVYSP